MVMAAVEERKCQGVLYRKIEGLYLLYVYPCINRMRDESSAVIEVSGSSITQFYMLDNYIIACTRRRATKWQWW